MKTTKVLIVRISSLGDILQTLPAIADAHRALPNIEFHWVVEEAFVDVARWHPAVKKVIPIALRRSRKHPFTNWFTDKWRQFKKTLRSENYDYIIDSQGLIKSAIISCMAHGLRCGLDWHSAREPLASLFYTKKFTVDRNQHIVTRTRQLFAKVLAYSFDEPIVDYGIQQHRFPQPPLTLPTKYIVCLTATTRANKHYPNEYWLTLMKKITAEGFSIVLPWGNEKEQTQANYFAKQLTNVVLLPRRYSLNETVSIMLQADGVIAVDTGLGHIAAAANVPTIILYGPTTPALDGTLGKKQMTLMTPVKPTGCSLKKCNYKNCTPQFPACFTDLTPQKVWQTLLTIKEM